MKHETDITGEVEESLIEVQDYPGLIVDRSGVFVASEKDDLSVDGVAGFGITLMGEDPITEKESGVNLVFDSPANVMATIQAMMSLVMTEAEINSISRLIFPMAIKNQNENIDTMVETLIKEKLPKSAKSETSSKPAVSEYSSDALLDRLLDEIRKELDS